MGEVRAQPSLSMLEEGVDINADGPLDRSLVGAQLAAVSEFRAVFSPRVESTTLALAWVASGQRLGYVTGAVIIAARDLAPHATLMQLVARHRSS